MKSLGKKIVAVMSAVDKVNKDARNDFHNYNYASDEAIVTEVRAAMIKHKLIAVPNQKSCTVQKLSDAEGDLTTIQVEYTLIDADSGEELKASVFGQGHDKLDKGVYKASTGAEKYFLLKTFMIPTGDDPERSNGSAPSRARPRPQRSTQTIIGEPQETKISPIEVKSLVSKKTGKAYWKVIDIDKSSYLVWNREIADVLKQSADISAKVSVKFMVDQFGAKITSLVEDGVNASPV